MKFVDFIDEIELNVQAGKGGNGCVSFASYYRNPKAGPDGGNGGKGGDVYLQGNEEINSFFSLKFKKNWIAEKGGGGKSKLRTGKKGQDVYVQVPLGTVVKLIPEINKEFDFLDQEPVLGEILFPQQILLVAQGGRGGKGNAVFANSINQTPNYAQSGQTGEKFKLKLELRTLAEVGLLGLPNAGKSTLANSLSEAKIKTANFPFTTLYPQLAVIKNSEKKIKLADLPGIIEGASLGKGLGLRFLKHIARCRLIVFVLDASQNPLTDLKVLQKELINSKFSVDKPKIFILNKIDLLLEEQIKNLKKNLSQELNQEKVIFLSALYKSGLEELIKELSKLLGKIESMNIDYSTHEFHKIYDLTVPSDWQLVSLRPHYWKLTGPLIKKLIQKPASLEKEIKKLPLEEIFNQYKVKKGDIIIINNQEFTWKD